MAEGNELKHCITGKETYFDRMAKQESYLLFLRKTDTPEKPYYTLEVEPDEQYARSGLILTVKILTLRKQKNFW